MKLLVVAPHLSTGGMPQYLLKYLEVHKGQYAQVKVVEFSNFSSDFVVQKDKIKILVGEENLISLGHYNDWETNYDMYLKKRGRLIGVIEEFQPDIVYMSGTPECYEYKLPPDEIMEKVYSSDRQYKIIETNHNNSFDFHNKRYIPDAFVFCSQVHMGKSSHIDVPKIVWEYPMEEYKRPDRAETLRELGLDPSYLHVLNVGLINPNKNQKYIFELADRMSGKKMCFHFIGNSCFMGDCGITQEEITLDNCTIWGERNDVDKFMSCMDVYLFPSKKELNPLTIKEALSWGMDVIANEDKNYTDQYGGMANFYLMGDINVEEFINKKLFSNDVSHNSLKDDEYLSIRNEIDESIYFKMFDVEEGEVVVDCGACVGLFALSAAERDISKCYCIEPSKLHFEDLKKNVQHDDRCVLINKAITDNSGTEKMFFGLGVGREEEVEVITFKDCMEAYGVDKVDFLKIDIEGFEYNLVFHQESFDWIVNNVDKFVGEIHLRWNRGFEGHYTRSHLREFLKKLQDSFVVDIKSCDGYDITEVFLGNYFLTDIGKLAWDYYSEVIFYARNKNDIKQTLQAADDNDRKFLIVSSFYNNTRDHIVRTFENVIKQTYKNWLLIVGDDFSNNGCGDILREEVKRVNHPNILYYDVKFKRELHLCQNFFKTINYDYFFELDADDILSDNLLEIYDAHFREYPNVFSIFCDYEAVAEDGHRERISVIKNADEDIDNEFYGRVGLSYLGIWKEYYSWNMYGHARCFRRSKRDKFLIEKNCKSSADTFSLFNCLQEGDHLPLPRNLYKLVNRENSDSSSVMSEEEIDDYNINALLAIREYTMNKKYGIFNAYGDIWYETNALSYSQTAKSFKDISLISDINEEQLGSIKFLYPDKNIVLNDLSEDNMVIVWDGLGEEKRVEALRALRENPRNFSIYSFFGDFDVLEEELPAYFQSENKKFFDRIDKYINGYSYFSYFRHTIVDSANQNMSARKLIHGPVENMEDMKILISLDSKSLGDTVAWMPYVEEFRKENNCKVVLSMFWRELFEKEYPDIEFVNPGTVVHNINGQSNIGWYMPWDKRKNPNNFKIIPLQQTASDILGLEYKEIRPKIYIPDKPRNIEGKYVCVGMQSTAQCKYWNYPNGWQEVVNYLRGKDYQVVMINKERGVFMGNRPPNGVIDKTGDLSIEERVIDLKYADAFIGIGSGLSWLSWAVGTPTILISGFSKPFCEFSTGVERLHKDDVCNGCFNDPDIEFDKGNWNWCPRGKDFECSKTITPDMVIEKIDEIIGSRCE